MSIFSVFRTNLVRTEREHIIRQTAIVFDKHPFPFAIVFTEDKAQGRYDLIIKRLELDSHETIPAPEVRLPALRYSLKSFFGENPLDHTGETIFSSAGKLPKTGEVFFSRTSENPDHLTLKREIHALIDQGKITQLGKGHIFDALEEIRVSGPATDVEEQSHCTAPERNVQPISAGQAQGSSHIPSVEAVRR